MTESGICCEDFGLSMESGTDNEGYGAVTHREEDGSYTMGSDLLSIRFCPWCGIRLGSE